MRGFIPTDNVRISLARDIHDGIAQDLVAVGYSLDALLAQPDLDQKTRSEIREIRLSLTQTLTRVRRELFDLRKNSGLTLREELTSLFEEITEGFEGNIEVEEISTHHRDLLLQIGRELLLNAVRHSHGTSIWLTLFTINNEILLTVADDGSGAAKVGTERLGLLGVQERLAEHGGSLTITGKHGSTVTARLPFSFS